MMKTVLRFMVSIILAFVLFLISTWLWWMYQVSHIADIFPFGFPFRFYEAWGPCLPGESCSEFNSLWLIADLIFWYLMSRLLVSWFQKLSRSTVSGKK